MAAILQKLPRWQIGRFDITGIARDTVRETGEDDVSGLAAEMAYHSLLAIVPFMLFLAGVTAIIDDVFGVGDLTDRIVDKAAQVMPEDATSLLRSFTSELLASQGGWAMAIGFAGALWASSSAMGTAMKALNRVYDVSDSRSFIKRRGIAIALTLLFAGMMLGAAALVATGRAMAGGIGEALGWESQVTQLWNALTMTGALLIVLMATALLYWLAPDTGHAFRWITPGAVLFTLGWVIASLAFAYYVSNFGSYNRTYGSIGAVIVLLVWLYWTNLILFMGAELNAVLARRHDPEYRRENPSQARG
jgi:membrane protein